MINNQWCNTANPSEPTGQLNSNDFITTHNVAIIITLGFIRSLADAVSKVIEVEQQRIVCAHSGRNNCSLIGWRSAASGSVHGVL